MLKINNKKKLEEIFANDFASPIYPILADIYLVEGNLQRAKKVCEIGLDLNPHNIDGKYILAKVAIKEKKVKLAEKMLKEVIENNPAHFNGLRLLIDIEIQLNRSTTTIQNYITRLLKFLPNDLQCITWLDKILQGKSLSTKTISKNDIVSQKNIDSETLQKNEKTYFVVDSMATFSMVQVLKSQKYYSQALAVLDSLNRKYDDKEKILKEKLEIEKLIETSQV